MGKTLAEKILSEKVGDARAGQIVIADVDSVLLQDGTGPLAVANWRELGDGLANPERTFVFLDHAAPSPRAELSEAHKTLRSFCTDTGARLFDVGEGVCHQLMVELFARPADVIVGADSHTCTSGALGAFATGMGSTDVAIAMTAGQTWLRVPESFLVKVDGSLESGVQAKDLILHLVGLIGSDGATYKALEFTGDAISKMKMADRLTICNMAVEMGAKTGLMPSDAVTREYLENCGRAAGFRDLQPDADADYEREISIEVDRLGPMVAVPHAVDKVVALDEVADQPVDQVFIGSCTGGRIEDLRAAAALLRGKKISPRIRLLVAPASRAVMLAAMKEGLMEVFLQAGGVIINPGCGACVGVHQGVLAKGEVCLGTQNRNFQGRMGDPGSFIYLASPATAAATAIEGKITDPRRFLS